MSWAFYINFLYNSNKEIEFPDMYQLPMYKEKILHSSIALEKTLTNDSKNTLALARGECEAKKTNDSILKAIIVLYFSRGCKELQISVSFSSKRDSVANTVAWVFLLRSQSTAHNSSASVMNEDSSGARNNSR